MASPLSHRRSGALRWIMIGDEPAEPTGKAGSCISSRQTVDRARYAGSSPQDRRCADSKRGDGEMLTLRSSMAGFPNCLSFSPRRQRLLWRHVAAIEAVAGPGCSVRRSPPVSRSVSSASVAERTGRETSTADPATAADLASAGRSRKAQPESSGTARSASSCGSPSIGSTGPASAEAGKRFARCRFRPAAPRRRERARVRGSSDIDTLPTR